MNNSRSSQHDGSSLNFIGWSTVIMLTISAACGLYLVAVDMLAHWEEDVALTNTSGPERMSEILR